jgi:hypothetical protein
MTTNRKLTVELPGGRTVEFHEIATTRKASQLHGNETLADGATIYHLSFQRSWIYAKCFKAGKPTTRRYRYDRDVKIIELQ